MKLCSRVAEDLEEDIAVILCREYPAVWNERNLF